jgi:hypothetical protein
MNPNTKSTVIGLVGPCKSGKTVLKRGLTEHGFLVKHIAQEHSYVKDMWQKIAKPDVLIFLEVSFEETLNRSALGWSENEYLHQLDRLVHAYSNADLIINTSNMTPEQVLERTLDFLRNLG